MGNVAVFVDAGYLFAQGSVALAGSQKSRADLVLNEQAAVAELIELARAKSNGQPLLRIYWYDAARGRHSLTLDHLALAHMDHVKLRLGSMSNQQQKGVDSLIVTDLIELARNGAMSDAVLMSGDEDVRVGVQIAQSFGVRVHLVGIKPSRGSQSLQLLQEADTTTEWDGAVVMRLLALQAVAPAAGAPQPASIPGDFEPVVVALVAMLTPTDAARLRTQWETSPALPPEIDGKLLASCRTALGTDLDMAQKRAVRRSFRLAVEALKG